MARQRGPNRRVFGTNQTRAYATAAGDGTWKQLTFSKVVAQADTLWLSLYGDMYTATSAAQPDSASVLYDDLQVTSSGRGAVLVEGFENGVPIGTDANSTTAWTSSGEVVEAATYSPTPTQWNRDVIYLGGQAVAEVDAVGVHELHSDHLGTPKLITKGYGGADKGTIEGRQEFGPYGEKLVSSGYVPLTGYTGHLQTDPTGLIYMRARYFSPSWHLFLNSDQGVDPMSLNQFSYTNNSPFQTTDPSGLCVAVYKVVTTYSGETNEPISQQLYFIGFEGCSSPSPTSRGGGGKASQASKKQCIERINAAYHQAIAKLNDRMTQALLNTSVWGQAFRGMKNSISGGSFTSSMAEKGFGLLGGYAGYMLGEQAKIAAYQQGFWGATASLGGPTEALALAEMGSASAASGLAGSSIGLATWWGPTVWGTAIGAGLAGVGEVYLLPEDEAIMNAFAEIKLDLYNKKQQSIRDNCK